LVGTLNFLATIFFGCVLKLTVGEPVTVDRGFESVMCRFGSKTIIFALKTATAFTTAALALQ
jgi:hypothetical protein